MATWAEIKSLASDFKRAQEVSSANKLSERNCIDIINYLISENSLKLHFTTDGKAILTPDELTKEIYEELEVQNHRVTLSNLSYTLDIDSKIVEQCVNSMLLQDDSLQIINNNLFDLSYIRMVSFQINDLLKERCSVNIAELTQKFDLPVNYLEKLIVNNSFGIIKAVKEGDIVFTESFVRRYTAIIRGYLSKASKPVIIYNFIDKQIVSEKIIKKIISDLVKSKRIDGTYDSNRVCFVPTIFLSHQKEYVNKYFESNGFVEYSNLVNIGVGQPSKFIESMFPKAVLLSNCAIGEILSCHIEEAFKEVINNKTFVDCFQILPFSINTKDLNHLITKLTKQDGNTQILDCGYFIHKEFMQRCFDLLIPEIKKRAEIYAKLNRKTLVTIFTEDSFKEDEQVESINSKLKNASKAKSGGGQRGREMKNKAVKNKYMCEKKKKSDINETDGLDSCFKENEMFELLNSLIKLENYASEFLEEVILLLDEQVNHRFRTECQSVVLQTSDAGRNKAEHQKYEAKILLLYNKIKIFIKGIEEISDENIKRELIKFQFKSVCTELVNCIFDCIGVDQQIEFDVSNANNDSRNKFITLLKGHLVTQAKNLNKSLKDSDSFDNYFSCFDELSKSIDIHPKQLDKKTEKRIIQEIVAEYHSIVLNKTDENSNIESAELLLITVLLLYYKIVGLPINASGKFVPLLLPYLQNKEELKNVDWDLLKKYQEYVVALVKFQGDEEEKLLFKKNHLEIHNAVFNIALNWKTLT